MVSSFAQDAPIPHQSMKMITQLQGATLFRQTNRTTQHHWTLISCATFAIAFSACSGKQRDQGAIQTAQVPAMENKKPDSSSGGVVFETAEAPQPSLSTNLLSYDTARVRCEFDELSTGRYKVYCQTVIQAPSGVEVKPVELEEGLQIDWQPAEILTGTGVVENCSSSSIFSSECEVILPDHSQPSEVQMSIRLTHKQTERTKLETRTVTLPYRVLPVAGFTPYLPVEFQGENQSSLSLSSMALRQLEDSPIEERRLGFQAKSYSLDETPFFQNANSTIFNSSCARGQKVYLANWSSIYEVENGKIKLFAGSGLAEPGVITNRLHIKFGPDLTVLCQPDALYVSDPSNAQILKLEDTGRVTRIAGQYGVRNSSPDGSRASKHPIGLVENMTFNPQNELIFAEEDSLSFRKINSEGLLETVATYEEQTKENAPLDRHVFKGVIQKHRSRQTGNVPALAFDSKGRLHYFAAGKLRMLKEDGTQVSLLGTSSTRHVPGGGPARTTSVTSIRGLASHPEGGLWVLSEDALYHLREDGQFLPMSKVYSDLTESGMKLVIKDVVENISQDTFDLASAPFILGQQLQSAGNTEPLVITLAFGVYIVENNNVTKITHQHVQNGFACEDKVGPSMVSLGASRSVVHRTNDSWMMIADPTTGFENEYNSPIYPGVLDAKGFLARLTTDSEGQTKLSLTEGCAIKESLVSNQDWPLQNGAITLLGANELAIAGRKGISFLNIQSQQVTALSFNILDIADPPIRFQDLSYPDILELVAAGKSHVSGPISRLASLPSGELLALNVLVKANPTTVARTKELIDSGLNSHVELFDQLLSEFGPHLGYRIVKISADKSEYAEVYRSPGFEGSSELEYFDALFNEISPDISVLPQENTLALTMPWKNQVVLLNLNDGTETLIAGQSDKSEGANLHNGEDARNHSLERPTSIANFSNGQLLIGEHTASRVLLLTPSSEDAKVFHREVLYEKNRDESTCGQSILSRELAQGSSEKPLQQSLDVLCKGSPKGLSVKENCADPSSPHSGRKIYVNQSFEGGLAANIFEITAPCRE